VAGVWTVFARVWSPYRDSCGCRRVLEVRPSRCCELEPSDVARASGYAVRTRRAAAAAVVIAFALMGVGCADLRRSFGADVALDAELKAQFQEHISALRIPDGVLMLSADLSQAEAGKVMPGTDRMRALRIAKFARAHYTDTIGLHMITVVFATRGDAGVLQTRHSYPGGTWSIASLDAEPDPEAPAPDVKHSYVPPNGFVPDSLTALRIAEAVLVPIYTAKIINAERPFQATLSGDTWTVEGSTPHVPPGKEYAGGVAVVEISKTDGRILRVSHGR
jgi:hypothetical protein